MVTYPISEDKLLLDAPIAAITTASRPENKLLFICARLNLDAAKRQEILALLNHHLDWDYLIKQAHRHGILPLLYWHLHQIDDMPLPTTAVTQLRQLFQQNVRSSLLLTGELLKLLTLFQEHNIPAVPYKGPVLAADVYGNLALRSFVDIDILVPRIHREEAKRLMLALGFLLKTHTPHAKEPDEFAYAFLSQSGMVYVEIHWGLTPGHFPFPLDMTQLWHSLTEVSLSGRNVANIPPDLLFIILCVHGSRHRWLRLGWIVDIAELVRQHPDLDWQRIMTLARQTGSLRMVWLGLHLIHGLLGVSLPALFDAESAAARRAVSLAAQVQHWLFTPPEGVTGDIEMYIFFYHMRERWQDKYKYLKHMMGMRLKPNEKDEAFVNLPPGWAFLHYLIRPYRLLKEYSQATWQYITSGRRS